MRTKYGIHPSSELVSLFGKKPYQGQAPERAQVVVLGNYANYSAKVSEHPFFKTILSYHRDGVTFWKKHGRHHPFLLDSYPFDRR